MICQRSSLLTSFTCPKSSRRPTVLRSIIISYQNGSQGQNNIYGSPIWLWTRLVLLLVWEMQTTLAGCSEKWKVAVQANFGGSGDTGENLCFPKKHIVWNENKEWSTTMDTRQTKPILLDIPIFEDFRGYLAVPYDQSINFTVRQINHIVAQLSRHKFNLFIMNWYM